MPRKVAKKAASRKATTERASPARKAKAKRRGSSLTNQLVALGTAMSEMSSVVVPVPAEPALRPAESAEPRNAKLDLT
jgi:hypothetical protein